MSQSYRSIVNRGVSGTDTLRGVDPEKQALKAFGAEIARARKQNTEHTQLSLAAALGVHSTYINKLERGKAGGAPSPELLAELAKALDLSLDRLHLILAPAIADRLPEEYRKFVSVGQQAPQAADPQRAARFPVYGLASCGTLVEAVKDDRLPSGELRLSEPWPEAVGAASSRRAFIVIAEGESMLPTIKPGDELLVDPDTRYRPKNGHVVLVQFRGETHVKRWRLVGNVIVLTPDNPVGFHPKEIVKGQFDRDHGTAWRVVRARTITDRSL